MIIDTPTGAVLTNADGRTEMYLPGTFMNALNQPWTGLHCIDTVRREAARKRIYFKTSCQTDDSSCTVTLSHNQGTLDYRINPEQDLIEEIAFHDINGNKVGEMKFEYLNPDQVDDREFRIPNYPKTQLLQPFGNHWLVDLANNDLFGTD